MDGSWFSSLSASLVLVFCFLPLSVSLFDGALSPPSMVPTTSLRGKLTFRQVFYEKMGRR